MRCSLVTGASGFIGARLVSRLAERGDEVVCLVRPSSDRSRLGGERVRFALGGLGDVASLSRAMEGVDTVYHLAGKTHAPRYEQFLEVNAGGTERLCRAATQQPSPPTVLVVSSLAAAGPSPPGVPHNEATPPEPISDYGRSKLEAERAARDHAERAPMSILRPPVVFGPGDRDGLLLFKAIRRTGLHLVPQLKGLPLSLVYVDDLIDAMIAIAERGERLAAPESGDPAWGLYYAADPQVASYAEMGRLAAAAMDRKVWVFCRRKYPFLIPALMGDLFARLTGGSPLLGMDKLREASASGWVCDPQKTIKTLGWQTKGTLAEQYRLTHEWYIQEGWL